MNILFVCTGNTCRSPMAKAIFTHLWPELGKADSAGIFAANGQDASINTVKVLEENDIHIKHRSKLLEEEDVNRATYVFTMTESHKAVLMDMYPGGADKIFTLKEFVDGKKGDQDVIDPFGGSLDVYRATFSELKHLIERLPEKFD